MVSLKTSIIFLFILLMIVGGVVVLYVNRTTLFKEKKKETGGAAETIVIGGDDITPTTETYIAMPGSDHVPISFSEYPVYAYDPDATAAEHSGTFWHKNKACQGGGLDCLYVERVENGRVNAITDKDGNNLIQQFVDDLYAGRLTHMDSWIEDYKFATTPTTETEALRNRFKLNGDNKLMQRKMDAVKWTYVIPGVDRTVGEYLLTLMILYKATGKRKPNVIIDLPAVKRGLPVGPG